MTVHKAISKHTENQHKRITMFYQLDAQREALIDEAVESCRAGQAVTVEKINEVTNQINHLAREGIVPTRKLVTVAMIKDYALRL